MAAAAPFVPLLTASATALSAYSSYRQSKKQAPSAPPPLEKPTVMPTPDDEAIRKSRRRSISEQIARRGRASTILTNPSGDETL